MDEYVVFADYDDGNRKRSARMCLMASSSQEARDFFIVQMMNNHGALAFTGITVIAPEPYLIALMTTSKD